MAFSRKKYVNIMVAGLSLLTILFMALLCYIEEQGNFHVITPDEAYRSAQLDRDELEHYARKYHLRSIINLRGKRPDKGWYLEEIRTARDLGIRHFDFDGIGASRPPSAQELKKLMHLMNTVPRPVLMHCKAGADRSGLAAAIWKVTEDGTSVRDARRQLSLRYGHMPFGPTHVLDTYFDSWGTDGVSGGLSQK